MWASLSSAVQSGLRVPKAMAGSMIGREAQNSSVVLLPPATKPTSLSTASSFLPTGSQRGFTDKAWEEGYERYSAIAGKLAAAAYCGEAVDDLSCGPNCDFGGRVKVRKRIDDPKNAAHALIGTLDDEFCVVAIRGSASLEAWGQNLQASHDLFMVKQPYICSDCKIAKGFLKVYRALARQGLADEVNRCGKPAILIGHSMGGAVADIAWLKLRRAVRAGIKFVFAFGSPRMGNNATQEAAELEMNKTMAYRITALTDPVVQVPPSSLGWSYRHVGREFFQEERNGEVKLCNLGGEDPDCSKKRPRAAFINDLKDCGTAKDCGHLFYPFEIVQDAALCLHPENYLCKLKQRRMPWACTPKNISAS